MFGTQTVQFAKCAHVTDDFLVPSGVCESECHHTLGIHHAARPKEHFLNSSDHPFGKEPVESVWERGDKTRMLIGLTIMVTIHQDAGTDQLM